jgi:diguanylate cyclase (GGDEF)-like protein
MSEAAPSQMLILRTQLLNRIWVGLLILALIGAPASASRALATGWIPLYTVHLCLAAIIVALFLLRRRLSFNLRAAAVLGIFFVVGAVGMLTLGLLGAGFWWLATATLLAGTLYSTRMGLAVAAVTVLLIAVSAVGFTSGTLKLPVDPATYVYAVPSWASFMLVAMIMPFVVFQSITLFQSATVELLEKVERQRAQIEQLATHDPLTGLPRWDLAVDRLIVAIAAAQRAGHRVGFLFIDLDGFKAINDTRGHEAGDRVLQAVAERLRASLRAEDTAARVGGDEFAVILGHLHDPAEALRAAERAIGAISVPVPLGDGDVVVGASIGVALFPDHAPDVRGLRRGADAAMYAAKNAGKNRAALSEARP